MKTYRVLLSMVLVLMLVSGLACGGSDNDDDDLAPDSIAGISYQVTVTSGTGLFATSGTATLAFSADDTYITTGDGNNTGDDNGTYTQTKLSSDSVEVVLNSATIPEFQAATYIFTYTSDNAGAFTATLPNGDTQSGTFQVL